MHQRRITRILVRFSEGLEIHPGMATGGIRARSLLLYWTVVTPIPRNFFCNVPHYKKQKQKTLPSCCLCSYQLLPSDMEKATGLIRSVYGGWVEIFKYTVVWMCVSRVMTLKYSISLFSVSKAKIKKFLKNQSLQKKVVSVRKVRLIQKIWNKGCGAWNKTHSEKKTLHSREWPVDTFLIKILWFLQLIYNLLWQDHC